MTTMFGWFNAEAERASFSNRPQAVGVGGDRIGQHLNRDLAAQPCVPGPIDFFHPTRAERAEDLVGAESHAGKERHGFVSTVLRTRSSAKRGSSSGLSSMFQPVKTAVRSSLGNRRRN